MNVFVLIKPKVTNDSYMQFMALIKSHDGEKNNNNNNNTELIIKFSAKYDAAKIKNNIKNIFIYYN